MEAEIIGTGKRKWLYPVIPKGPYYQYRSWLSYIYLIFFFSGPFIRIGGQPLLLLNFPERKFVLVGQVFWPQDIFLFMMASLVFIVCIVFFTLAFGRIFCGWICPQTIFMEMVFRKIEIWIEGDSHQRKKMDQGPWTAEKIRKKTLKNILFLLVSFLIANTFLAYIIGSEALIQIVTEPVRLHIAGLASISAFTLVFFAVYSQVREFVCTLICPYGRLQGVLTDKDTLMVAYNDFRGEPRGHLIKDPVKAAGQGDCVDCGLCVAVCPTGIDIRKGTQLECINCTACIDACDEVMVKIHKPKNLIGFYSENLLHNHQKPRFTPKMMGYSGVILILISVLSYFILSRSILDITIMRYGGLLYQEMPGGKISNLYNAEIINKSKTTQEINLVPDNPAFTVKYIQAPGSLAAGKSVKTVFFIIAPGSKIHDTKTDIHLSLMGNHKLVQKIRTNFLGPMND